MGSCGSGCKRLIKGMTWIDNRNGRKSRASELLKSGGGDEEGDTKEPMWLLDKGD